MEAKKNARLDFYKLSGLFFNLGLVISISIVYFIFQIEFKTDQPLIELANSTTESLEILDIPSTVQPPPPPPKLQIAQIREVADENILTLNLPVIDMEMNEDSKLEKVEYQESIVLDELSDEKLDEIFMIVEEDAEPVGGVEAFYQYVALKLKDNYPAAAERMGVQGVVYIQFIVEKDGTLTDIHAIKGIGSGCDKLAIEVLKTAPNWKPGKQRGRAVRTRRIVPIRFILRQR